MAKHRFPWERSIYRRQGWDGVLPCDRLILSLCDESGEWPRYYREAGYPVRCIDAARGEDVRLLTLKDIRAPVYGVLAAPPCNKFSQWGRNTNGPPPECELRDALSVVDACLRIVAATKPVFWSLENPSGRLREYLGEPAFTFHPMDFGGWLAQGEARNGVEFDAYRKRTLLWGEFNPPERRPVEPAHYYGSGAGSWTTHVAKESRSVTPRGFSRAFFEANR